MDAKCLGFLQEFPSCSMKTKYDLAGKCRLTFLIYGEQKTYTLGELLDTASNYPDYSQCQLVINRARQTFDAVSKEETICPNHL